MFHHFPIKCLHSHADIMISMSHLRAIRMGVEEVKTAEWTICLGWETLLFLVVFWKNDETWRSRPFKAFLGALMEDKKWRGFIVIHLGPIVHLRTWQWHTVTVNYGDQSTKEHSIFILDYIITRYQRTRTCRDCRDETATIGINKKQVGDWPTQIWRWTSWPLFGGGGLTHKIYLHGT